MIDDGWHMSKLEVALFFLFKGHERVGVLVSHVDDVLCGCKKGMNDSAFKIMRKTFKFGRWESLKDGAVFRGRELKHLERCVNIVNKNIPLNATQVLEIR